MTWVELGTKLRPGCSAGEDELKRDNRMAPLLIEIWDMDFHALPLKVLSPACELKHGRRIRTSCRQPPRHLSSIM
jgi:hypothetical protein